MLNVRVRACGSVCQSVIIVTVVWFQRVKPESVLNQRCDFVNLGIGILSQARPPTCTQPSRDIPALTELQR